MRSNRSTLVLACLLFGGCGDRDEGEIPAESDVNLASQELGSLQVAAGEWNGVDREAALPLLHEEGDSGQRNSASRQPAPTMSYQEGGGGEVGRRLQEMDTLAAGIYEADEQALRDLASELAHTVDWAGKTPGYGNFLLASRAQDLGSIALARLLVDCELGVVEAKGILEQLESWEPTPEWRAAVLDQELETTAFSEALARAGQDERVDRLHHLWEAMKQAVKFEREGEAILLNAAATILSRIEALGITRGLYEELREVLEAEIAYGRLMTSTERWRRRQLGLIAGSSPPDSLRRVRSLVEYKELVGSYPTEPPPKPTREGVTSGNRTDIQRAFGFELSKLNLSLRYRSISTLAGETYERVKAQELVDLDTQIRRNWETGEAVRRVGE